MAARCGLRATALPSSTVDAAPALPSQAVPAVGAALPGCALPLRAGAASAPRRSAARRLASLSGARLLAWTGATVTLLGVVLLLALAAARGWFAPPVRVGGGAVLGLALVELGIRLHRRATARSGALAVTGTGIATLYLVVAATTALYRYLPVPVGLLLALLVAAAGLALADRRRAVLLGRGAVVGAALLAPVVTGRPTPLFVALVLVLQVAATVVALRRRWPVLAGIGAGWPVLYGTVVAGLAEPADRGGSDVASTAVLVVGVAAAAWSVRPEPLPRGLRIGLVMAAPVPALTYAAAEGGGHGAVLAFLAAVLLFAVAALPGRDTCSGSSRSRPVPSRSSRPPPSRSTATPRRPPCSARVWCCWPSRRRCGRDRCWSSAGSSGRPVCCPRSPSGPAEALAPIPPPRSSWASPPSARRWWPRSRCRPWCWPPPWPRSSRRHGSACWCGRPGGAAVGARRAGRPLRRRGARDRPRAARGADPAGFVAGHAVVTVSWTVVALVLLARGIRRPALRVAGLVLVAAAVAKLVLFDLVALDGLARVAAFLGAGLLLLAAGTRYARLVAEAESSDRSEAAAGVESDPAAGTDPASRPRT